MFLANLSRFLSFFVIDKSPGGHYQMAPLFFGIDFLFYFLGSILGSIQHKCHDQ